jgi:hypothetical protein
VVDHGIGATLAATYTEFAARASAEGMTTEVIPVDYDAQRYDVLSGSNVEDLRSYSTSITASASDLVKQLRDVVRRRCEVRPQIVVMGYSQGAMVVSRALSQITQGERTSVTAVVQYGNPTFRAANAWSRNESGNPKAVGAVPASRTAARGTPYANLQALLPVTGGLLPDLANRSLDLCVADDFACGATEPVTAAATAANDCTNAPACGHLQYVNRFADGSSFVLGKVKRIQFPPLVITPAGADGKTLPDAALGSDYQVQLQASGGKSPYRWNKFVSELPFGLSLSRDGLVTGKPRTPGPQGFKAQVTDARGKSTAHHFKINISKSPAPLVVQPLPGQAPGVLPAAAVGAEYSAQLLASGGRQPYTWTATAPLPAGLSLSTAGAVTGTPGTAGAATVKVRVTDSGGAHQDATFTLATATGRAREEATVRADGSAQLAVEQGRGQVTVALAAGSAPRGEVLTVRPSSVEPFTSQAVHADPPLDIELSSGQPTTAPGGPPPVTLTRTFTTALDAKRGGTFIWLNTATMQWEPVPTVLAEDRRTATARLDHLSTYSWIDYLQYGIQKTFSTRIDPPECNNSTPLWVSEDGVTFLDELNSPLRWCAGSDPTNPDLLVIKVRRNREAGAFVTPAVTPTWTYNSAFTSKTEADGIINAVLDPFALRAQFASGGQFLPGGEEVSFGFSRQAVAALGERSVPLVTVKQDLAVTFAGHIYQGILETAGDLPADSKDPLKGLAGIAALRQVAECYDGINRSTTPATLTPALTRCFGDSPTDVIDNVLRTGIGKYGADTPAGRRLQAGRVG